MICIDGILVSPGKPEKSDRSLQGFRVWRPEQSKFAALWYTGIAENLVDLTGSRLLYLGAGNGSTVSFMADYAEVVYAVEFAPRPMRDLIALSERRDNIIPIFADARYPCHYIPIVERVDYMYMDVAQRSQADIAIVNRFFLKENGYVILVLKTKSVSVRESVDSIVSETITQLSEFFHIAAHSLLLPYYPDHAGIICIPRPG